MGTLRVEYVPVQQYFLGKFGFDHLHLVYEDESSPFETQDFWLVLEGAKIGLFEPTLGMIGENFKTPLSAANGGLTGDELIDKIGTPESRGSRIIYQGPLALEYWEQMMSYGSEIEAQAFPYIGFALPFGTFPTVNSSSAVASVLKSIGIDINLNLPSQLGLSPGTSTLLGTSSGENLSASLTFNQLLGGGGDDTMNGTPNVFWMEKFYGGSGNDYIYWSPGEEILHGGQYRMPYALDGFDTADYAGVGQVSFYTGAHSIEHKTPDFYSVHPSGTGQHFSIEAVKWFKDKDVINIGPGVEFLELPVKFELNEAPGPGLLGDEIRFAGGSTPLLVNVVGDTTVSIQTIENRGLDAGFWVDSVEAITGSSQDDLIYAGATITVVDGGNGDDLLDGRLATPFSGGSPNSWDIELFGGEGDDTIVSGAGWTYADGGAGSDIFVLSAMSTTETLTEFNIANADSDDKLYVAFNFFTEERTGYDGSELFQLSGAPFQLTDLMNRSKFYWGLPDENQAEGFITFLGDIAYEMEGSDLIITLQQGFTDTFTIDYGPGEPPGPEVTVVVAEGETETRIRVEDWQEGDLGISFPIEYDIEVFAEAGGLNDYPGFESAVLDAVSPSRFIDALDPRPDAHVPLEFVTAALTARTMALDDSIPTDGDDTIVIASSGSRQIDGLGGNDHITGSDGGDVINGGSGSDVMTGGRGNDTYFVDDAGDQVVEALRGGFDKVYSAIDYQIGENVEHLTLTGQAISGTGNSLRNKLAGNTVNNVLSGGEGDDTLAGNEGDDLLMGGDGGDGYVYGHGDGYDTIVESLSGTRQDVIVFSGVFAPDDIVFLRDPDAMNDLILRFTGGGGITIRDHFLGAAIETIEFATGAAWAAETFADYASNAVVTSNDIPVAQDDRFILAGPSSFTILASELLANDSDRDSDTLSISAISGASQGSVTIDQSGNLQVTTDGFSNSLNFKYTVSDGQGGFASAFVDIGLLPNSAPVITATALAPVNEDAEATGFVSASDADGDALSYNVKSGAGPQLGTVTIDGSGAFVYRPNADANGADRFTIIVTDLFGAAAEHTFDVSIAAENDAPVIAAAVLGPVTEDQQVAGHVVAADIDGDTLSYEIKAGAGPAKGSVTFTADGAFNYNPNANENGADSFTILVRDGQGGTAEHTFGFAIASVNDAPLAAPLAALAAIEDQAVSGQISAADPDGDALTYSIKAGEGPGKGNVTFDDNGGYVYTPGANANGSDGFTIVVRDAQGAEAEQRVDVTIQAVNDAPVATNDAGFSLTAGTTLTISKQALLANDTDIDGDTLSIIGATAQSGGTVTIDVNGNLVFNAFTTFSGAAAFSYTVSDGNGGTANALVSLNVNPEVPSTGVNLTGTDGADTLTGTAFADVIYGKAGNDTLRGLGGNDTFRVDGDDGLDVINGGNGYDKILGGANNDTIRVSSHLENLTSIEEINGGGGFDRIWATAGNDALDFSSIALKGIEQINLGEGNDWVRGSSANDTFVGGGGADRYVFRTGGGHDVINDFNNGALWSTTADKIDITSFNFSNYFDLYAHMRLSGADVILTLDATTSVTLKNATLSTLWHGNFEI